MKDSYKGFYDIFEYIEQIEPKFSIAKYDKPIIVSFSGGRSSAMMVMLFENNKYLRNLEKHYVFANTGRETSSTLNFIREFQRVQQFDLKLIEGVVHNDERKSSTHQIVDFQTLSREGEPFENMIVKYGLPNVAFPHCTRELKINPIRSFIKNDLGYKNGEFIQAIGMRADEPRRIRQNDEFIYPLFDFGLTKADVNEFWNHEDVKNYTLNIEEFEGNCDLCFKKSWSKLKLMASKKTSAILWWDDMQEKYGKLNGDNIYRGQKSARDLLRASHEDDNYDNEDLACSCSHSELSSFILA